MVMPIGPDISRAIGIPLDRLGLLGSAYTGAAAVAGILGMFLLGRFARKSALIVCLLGLAAGTLAGGLAQGMGSLMASRIVAGIFGGPATSLTIALVADCFAIERRGRAMGAVMTAFAVAAVVGVPLTLKLSELGTWSTPFFFVALITGLATFLVAKYLPGSAGLPSGEFPGWHRVRKFLSQKIVWAAYLATCLGMMSGFAIIPNIAAYIQNNLGFPREHMGELYLAGGLASLVAMRIGGICVDRFGSARVTTLVSLCLATLLFVGIVKPVSGFSPLILFMTFMPVMSMRNVSFQTLHTKVPLEEDRAIYMPGLSTINSLGSATGAYLATQFLSADAHGVLLGMPQVALISIVLTLALVPLIWYVENSLQDS